MKIAVAVDLRAEGDAGQDGELVRRVEPVDVEARIGLGVAELLRFLQRSLIGLALLHLGEDEVAGAVQDAVEARQAVAGERFAQRLDDRDAAADRRLEGERRAALLRKLRQLHAVRGEQRLVGGHHALARARAPPCTLS